MKLIEAEKAKDVIHEYFKSLMVNGASGTDVDRLAVGIGSCLKHDANLLKAIDELPSAEPEAISRWKNEFKEYVDSLDIARDDWKGIIEYIDELPPMQPERKTGHWIAITSRNNSYKCSVCGRLLTNITDGKNKVAKNYPYCHCGADMRGEG